MAQFNENITLAAPNPLDKRYLSTRTSNGSQVPYSGTSEVTGATGIPLSQRYTGLTVLIQTGSTSPVEYWFKNNITTLVEKKSSSEISSTEFITGATNLGYFSGMTGIQSLDLSGTGFTSNVGEYFSEYNWYYVDAGGIIRIGSPTHDGFLRRAYVNLGRTKSWIYSIISNSWEISLNDVVAEVGNSYVLSVHTDYVFTATTWVGSIGVAAASVTATGSLTTGTTITIGNPIYSYKADQDLNFKTPISDTPEVLKITNDDNYIRFSGSTGTQLLTASNGLTKTGTEVKFGGTITGTTTIIDSRATPVGIQYDNDYSSTFTDRSLIDKGYLNTISLSGGERIYKIINQPHNFIVNDVVGWSGGTYNKPIADGTYDGEVIGIVTKNISANSFEVTQAGYVTGLTATLTMNTTYFLSDETDGLLTSIEPIVPNYISKSVLITTSSSSGWVLPYAGYVITSGVTGGALIKSVCLPTTTTYYVTPTDYYIGVSAGTRVYLQPNLYGIPTRGTVIVVADTSGNASGANPILISGDVYGYTTAEINTTYGSLSFLYNGNYWSVVGFAPTPS